jgi:hypothetical protein
MIRKCVLAFVLVAFSVGVLSAAEMTGIITKVDGSKITFKEFKKGDDGKFVKGEFGAEKTYTVTKDAKILKGGVMFGKGGKGGKGKGGEPTPLEGGLSNDVFKNIGEKGLVARITTNDSNEVTEIRTFAFGGKKKKKDGGD